MKELIKEFGKIGVRLLLFAIGFCACMSMLSGMLVVMTTMGVLKSILTAIIPSILFGIWVQHLTKEDLEED